MCGGWSDVIKYISQAGERINQGMKVEFDECVDAY